MINMKDIGKASKIVKKYEDIKETIEQFDLQKNAECNGVRIQVNNNNLRHVVMAHSTIYSALLTQLTDYRRELSALGVNVDSSPQPMAPPPAPPSMYPTPVAPPALDPLSEEEMDALFAEHIKGTDTDPDTDLNLLRVPKVPPIDTDSGTDTDNW